MKADPDMYDVVCVKRAMPEHGLAAGARGTVVMDYSKEARTPTYEVEFCDSDGVTIALATLAGDDLEVVWRSQDS